MSSSWVRINGEGDEGDIAPDSIDSFSDPIKGGQGIAILFCFFKSNLIRNKIIKNACVKINKEDKEKGL